MGTAVGARVDGERRRRTGAGVEAGAAREVDKVLRLVPSVRPFHTPPGYSGIACWQTSHNTSDATLQTCPLPPRSPSNTIDCFSDTLPTYDRNLPKLVTCPPKFSFSCMRPKPMLYARNISTARIVSVYKLYHTTPSIASITFLQYERHRRLRSGRAHRPTSAYPSFGIHSDGEMFGVFSVEGSGVRSIAFVFVVC